MKTAQKMTAMSKKAPIMKPTAHSFPAALTRREPQMRKETKEIEAQMMVAIAQYLAQSFFLAAAETVVWVDRLFSHTIRQVHIRAGMLTIMLKNWRIENTMRVMLAHLRLWIIARISGVTILTECCICPAGCWKAGCTCGATGCGDPGW